MAAPLAVVPAEEGDDGEIVVGAGELLLDLEVYARGNEGGACASPFGGFWRLPCEPGGFDFEDGGFVDLLAEEVGVEYGVKVGREDEVWMYSPDIFLAGGFELLQRVVDDAVFEVVP